jgi:HEPN domain
LSQDELDDLVLQRVIERVAADPETAQVELDQARLHVESAAEIAERDPVAAFAIGYDAIRKALSAHMRHHGYRVGKVKGHHARTGRYAMAAIDDPRLQEHLEVFDELRQLRNQSEYDAVLLDTSDVNDALARADAIIGAVSKDLDA